MSGGIYLSEVDQQADLNSTTSSSASEEEEEEEEVQVQLGPFTY